MMRNWITYLLTSAALLASANVFSQRQITLSGKVNDVSTGRPVGQVNVSIGIDEDYTGTSTNSAGRYQITFAYQQGMTIAFSYTGKKELEYELDGLLKTKDQDESITLNTEMEVDVILLQGATITADYRPETIVGSPQYSVEDFEFWDEHHLILLAYEKTLKKGAKILLVDTRDSIGKPPVSTYFVPGQAVELYRDYQGDISVLCEKKIFLIEVEHNELILTPREKDQFNQNIKPVIDTTEGKVYISSFSKDFPAFNYYSWARGDSLPEHLTFIVDDFMMELLRSEFKYLPTRKKLEAVRLGMQYKIDKEIAAAFLSGFAQSIYYEPLYAPLFVINDTVNIFDHYKDYLYKFDADNNVLDSTKISYHRIKKRNEWRKQMIQDSEDGRVYALFRRNGFYFLKEINHGTGKVAKTFKFTWKYTDRVQVRDDYVYYVYRPFESTQKKFLYRELIRNQQ